MMIDGAFNVNSTSVGSMEGAVLSSLRATAMTTFFSGTEAGKPVLILTRVTASGNLANATGLTTKSTSMNGTSVTSRLRPGHRSLLSRFASESFGKTPPPTRFP